MVGPVLRQKTAIKDSLGNPRGVLPRFRENFVPAETIARSDHVLLRSSRATLGRFIRFSQDSNILAKSEGNVCSIIL